MDHDGSISKGGRPSKVKDPKVLGTVVAELANGAKQRDAARAAGVSQPTVSRIAQAHEEEIEAKRRAIQDGVAEMVLDGYASATQARLVDASAAESRTGPQSYRALMEAVGLVGKGHTHVGDVNVDQSVTAVDARSVLLLTPEVRRAALEEARTRLGIG